MVRHVLVYTEGTGSFSPPSGLMDLTGGTSADSQNYTAPNGTLVSMLLAPYTAPLVVARLVDGNTTTEAAGLQYNPQSFYFTFPSSVSLDKIRIYNDDVTYAQQYTVTGKIGGSGGTTVVGPLVTSQPAGTNSDYSFGDTNVDYIEIVAVHAAQGIGGAGTSGEIQIYVT